jgi:hypothetical protein
MPESDKARRQRQLDHLAFNVLAGRYTGPDSWMRWSDWFELTKAKQGVGNTTFSDCTKRLLEQGKVRQSQIAKNRFYQAVFTPGSSVGVDLLKSDCQESSVVLDKAAQALEHLLNRKPPDVV